MQEPQRAPTATAGTAPPEQQHLDLAPAPDRVEKEEADIQGILDRSTQSVLARIPQLGEKEVDRILQGRAQLIKRVRAIAIGQTEPPHWTLYRARDGGITSVPASPACLVMRRWAGISIRNHRSMSGQPGVATISKVQNSKGEDVLLAEMMADGFWGQASEPDVEAVYANLRSDDDFTGRTKRDEKYGGPRPEDLRLSIRTTLDSKVVRAMLGLTKVTGEELARHGMDLDKCTKGSGFGSAQERTAGKVAQEGVPQLAKALWDEIVRRTGGNVGEAKQVLVDLTMRAANPKKEGDKGFRGFDSWERFTEAWQVENAAKALKTHEVFGDKPQTGQ